MFKSLSRSFDRKKNNFNKVKLKQLDLIKIVSEFISINLGMTNIIKDLIIEYKHSDKILVISCPNKIVANEIFLRQKELRSLIDSTNHSDVKLIIK